MLLDLRAHVGIFGPRPLWTASKNFVQSLRRHTDQARTRKKADWPCQKCQNHAKCHSLWYTMILTGETHRFQHITTMFKNWSTSICWENCRFHHPQHLATKNPENDAVLARTYFNYVRAQNACLLSWDRSQTLEFPTGLALWSQEGYDVFGECHVLTDFILIDLFSP